MVRNLLNTVLIYISLIINEGHHLGFPFHEVPSPEFSPSFYWIIFLIICRSSLYILDTYSSFYQVCGLPSYFPYAIYLWTGFLKPHIVKFIRFSLYQHFFGSVGNKPRAISTELFLPTSFIHILRLNSFLLWGQVIFSYITVSIFSSPVL